MKKTAIKMILASLVLILGLGFFAINTYAEEGENNSGDAAQADTPKTSLTLTPVSRVLEVSSNSEYGGTLSATNDGSETMKVEVYAAPYAYFYSQEEDIYKLGFSTENNFTQISRWISIKDQDGNYVKRPSFEIPAKGTLNVDYKITTPDNIPAGGQYAVLFVQTISDKTDDSGIRTEASAGMVIYGHSTEGEAIITSSVKDMTIGNGKEGNNNQSEKSNIYGFAKVKNEGNVDFYAKGTLKVEPIIGFSSYETPSNGALVSVIPESERIVKDVWNETPDFGIYKATWTISAGGQDESIEQIIFLISPIAIIIAIMVLTFIIIVLIMVIRKRKERRSRLAV